MEPIYRKILKNELNRRIEKNSFYSLRAFARDLKVSPSRLSEAINGVRGISLDFAKNVCQKINLDKKWTDIFLTSVTATHARSRKIKLMAQEKLKTLLTDDLEDHPKTDTIVAWYFGGVLKLYEKEMTDMSFISKLLSITHLQVETAFRFLKRLGFIESLNKSAFLKHKGTGRVLNTDSEQILKLSQKAINAHLDSQIFNSFFLNLNTDQIIEAKKILKKCHRDLLKLESQTFKMGSQIFIFTNHLFPTNNKNNGDKND